MCSINLWKMNTFLRLIALLCFVSFVCCQYPNENFDDVGRIEQTSNRFFLPKNAIPLHYHVQLDTHTVGLSAYLKGKTSIVLQILQETMRLTLHAKYLLINERETTLTTEQNVTIWPTEHEYDDSTEMLHINFLSPLIPAKYTLNFTYRADSQNDMFGFYDNIYRDKNGSIKRLLVTHLQPIFARRVFPCWDEPALKSTFDISIKHDSNYTALSNMPVFKQEFDNTDGKTWTHFQRSPLMSTNILAFVVADYTNVSNADGTIRLWARESVIDDARYMLGVVETANGVLTQFMNSTVRVPKMDHVAVPYYTSRATENWGLIVYHENAVLYNEDSYMSDAKQRNILTAVHEISHQWFGNLVSPASWKYYWLSEGMTTYLKYYIGDMMYNDWRLMDYFVVLIQQQVAFNADDRDNVVPINKELTSPSDLMNRNSAIIYRKSASVIRMLSHIISENVFRTGLLKYIAENEYSNVTSDDLWKAMQDALIESNVTHENITIKRVMDTWTDQTGYPLVTVTRDNTTGDVIVCQEPSPTNRDLRYKRWWIPISYTTKSQLDFDNTFPLTWLSPDEETIRITNIPISDWIIVNVQETGYYRVNYDPINWLSIVEYLNSGNYTKIHAVNRAQLIDDAYTMMKKKRLDLDIFIQLLNYLSRETDYIPWTPVLYILDDISKYLKDPEGAAALNPYILSLMDNYLESFGYDERPDDNLMVKIARQQILILACELGHDKCRRNAADRLIAYIEDPIRNKISYNLRYSMYCMGLMKANQTIWNRLFALTNYTVNYRTLQYLSCSENPEIVNNFLTIVFSNRTILSTVHFPDVLSSLNRHMYTNVDVELNFTINNWDSLSQSEFDPNEILEDIIHKISREDQFERLQAFLETIGLDKYADLEIRKTIVQKIHQDIAYIRNSLENANRTFN